MVISNNWNIRIQDAIVLQKQMQSRVIVQSVELDRVRFIVGLDASYIDNKEICAAAIIWDYLTHEIVEWSSICKPVSFPYIPGFLSFRETPALIQSVEQLSHEIDILIVDGHGTAHPRRFGIANHIGVLLGIPTIGCAKSLFVGNPDQLANVQGSMADVIDSGELVGKSLRTKYAVKPVYVSVGNLVDLDSATKIVFNCCCGYRLPEPCRLAHKLAGIVKKIRIQYI